MTQAVILSGEFRGATNQTRKSLLPVAGWSFLNVLVSELRRQNADDVLILAGAQNASIKDQFANDASTNIVIVPEAMGTAGALRFVAERLQNSYFVFSDRSLFDINLHDLALSSNRAVARLALRRAPDTGFVEIDKGGRILRYGERALGAGPSLMDDGGIGYLSREILEYVGSAEGTSLKRDIYPVLAQQQRLFGTIYDRPFVKIGAPEESNRARTQIRAVLRRGAVIFDRDGVLNEDISYAHRPDQIRWVRGAREAVKLVNDAGLLALIATNQSGIAQGYYTEEDMHALHDWMRREFHSFGAHIDAIAYCPYHPEGAVEAYRRASALRKPGPGMLLQLMETYDVDKDHCVLVGDKDTDMTAARAAGIEGIRFRGDISLLEAISAKVAQLSAQVKSTGNE